MDLMYFRFNAISSWVSTSETEPNEMYRNWINSFVWNRAAPSEMFEQIDTPALRSCVTRPNFSVPGKVSVIL